MSYTSSGNRLHWNAELMNIINYSLVWEVAVHTVVIAPLIRSLRECYYGNYSKCCTHKVVGDKLNRDCIR